MNITLLHNDFNNIGYSDFDSTDPRLDEIATLVQNGEFIEAARLSELIISSGIYDIRLVCYFLYGYWLENGLVGLIDVADSLHNIIGNNWEVIGPINKREKVFEKSLEWLFKQILKTIQYENSKKTIIWEEWKNNTHSDDINNILESSDIFRLSFNDRFDNKLSHLIDLWSKIEKWLSIFQQVECQSALESSKLIVNGIDDEIVELDDSKEEKSTASNTTNTIPSYQQKLTGTECIIQSSYHMDMLIIKLNAFEKLIEEENFPKAALIADDINYTLRNFDPKFYFPKVFETFVRLQAINFSELEIYENHRDSQHWQVMQEWLKVDIDGFVNSKLG